MKTRYVVRAGGREHSVEIWESDGGYHVSIDGTVHAVDSSRIDGTHIRSILVEGRSYEINCVPEGDRYDVYCSGEIYPVEVVDEVWARAQGAGRDHHAGGEIIEAPIPGAMVKLLVAPGDLVEAGQSVAILEAMKMQNELLAMSGGVVFDIRVKVGDTVNQGDTVMVLKPDGAPGAAGS